MTEPGAGSKLAELEEGVVGERRDAPGNSCDRRGAGGVERGQGTGAPGSAESKRKRLSSSVVPSIPHARAASAPTGGSFFVESSDSTVANSRLQENSPFDIPAPYSPAAGTIDCIAIQRVRAQAPEGYRKVFVWTKVFGQSQEEAAARMGNSAGTSKSQPARGRGRLRKLLTLGADA